MLKEVCAYQPKTLLGNDDILHNCMPIPPKIISAQQLVSKSTYFCKPTSGWYRWRPVFVAQVSDDLQTMLTGVINNTSLESMVCDQTSMSVTDSEIQLIYRTSKMLKPKASHQQPQSHCSRPTTACSKHRHTNIRMRRTRQQNTLRGTVRLSSYQPLRADLGLPILCK